MKTYGDLYHVSVRSIVETTHCSAKTAMNILQFCERAFESGVNGLPHPYRDGKIFLPSVTDRIVTTAYERGLDTKRLSQLVRLPKGEEYCGP